MNSIDKNKPHGLGIGLKVEIFNNIDGKLIPVSSYEEENSKLEAYINIKNETNGKEVELPMRSFVQRFLSILYKYFSGSDSNASGLTRNSTASAPAITTTASNARKRGLMVGTGVTPVTLSDSDVETDASHASLAYGVTTFVAPYVDNINTRTMKFELRRMLTSTKQTTTYISELVVKTRPVGATAASTGLTGTTISRDILDGSPEEQFVAGSGIPIDVDEGIAFQFKFKISQVTSGAYQGGAVLNFVKMIYNQLFKGNPNASQLLSTAGANLTISYSNASIATQASVANPFYVAEEASAYDYGILVGVYDYREEENPPINCDDYNFYVKSTNITFGATEVAAITNPSLPNTAQFIVSRTFTNSGTNAFNLNRAGLKIKGGAFIAINSLAQPGSTPTFLTLQPNQVLKISYPFQIQA